MNFLLFLIRNLNTFFAKDFITLKWILKLVLYFTYNSQLNFILLKLFVLYELILVLILTQLAAYRSHYL